VPGLGPIRFCCFQLQLFSLPSAQKGRGSAKEEGITLFCARFSVVGCCHFLVGPVKKKKEKKRKGNASTTQNKRDTI
jgi:hypothetical protein